jgi:hypothetical protein
MTVVVEDGLRRGKLTVKPPRRIVREKKIFGEESLHLQVSRLVSESRRVLRRFRP